MYLEKINSPADVKKLSSDEMKKLAEEMRTALIKKLSVHGGHCGPLRFRLPEGQAGVRRIAPDILPQNAHRQKLRVP